MIQKFTIFTVCFLFGILQLDAQKLYKKIPEKIVNSEKVTYAKNFISDFLKKCENKDYSKFANYNLSVHFENFLNKNLEQICKNNTIEYGKIDLENLNSLFNDRYTNLYNPTELYIYNVNTEKNNEIKFLSIWMSQNENRIDGLWISADKPFEKPIVK